LIGAFVTVDSDNALAPNPLAVACLGVDGIGRLIAVEGLTATVEYFVSPAGPKVKRKKVDARRVRRVIPWAETPVFWLDESAGAWRRGRIKTPESEAADPKREFYWVRFPNGQDGLLPGAQLNVRWAHPVEDPVEYLAARVTDTPFFLEGRKKVLGWLAEQRSAFGGLTGLASASVDLHRHQIEIVRRVLADPVQRYLLADEVGLGKTIEACSIIRQHLIDEPRAANVAIVVPDHLVRQWRGELSVRFGIVASDARVTVHPESDIVSDATSFGTPTLLVIDEAHRCASNAFSGENGRIGALYRRLESLASGAPRILLLSGTPVLHQEDGFLAMLHLLDPVAYPLQDREAFRQRVRSRAAVADAVAQLTDDAPPTFLEDAVTQLEHAFGNDLSLRALTAEVARLVEVDGSNPARIGAIRALRSHVVETYRLHRRLLRTRRDDPSVQHLLAVRMGLDRLPCDDPARRLAWELIEEWRRALPTDMEGKPPIAAAPVFAELVEAAFSHPSVLAKYMRARCSALRSSARHSSRARTSQLHEEPGWYARSAEALEQAALSEPRVDALADWLTASKKKAIIFVDDPEVASRVATALSERLPNSGVLQLSEPGAEGEFDQVASFLVKSEAKVIVVDKRVEEGVNLQGTRAVLVHYDLPFAPTRIEQRNGRIDRLDAMSAPRFLAFEGASPYEVEWTELLEKHIRVFDRTVASLQYVLAQSSHRLRQCLVSLGVHAFLREGAVLDGPGGLDDELKLIRQQEGLDSLGLVSEVDERFVSNMYQVDEMASLTNGADCEEWLCRRLRFRRSCVGHAQDASAFHYEYALADRPLLPLHAVVTNFAHSIDRVGARGTVLRLGPFTYDRECALENEKIRLLRPGNPFLDGVADLIRCDDRGAAFVMWRHDSSLPVRETRLFFCVEFVVETDVAKARAVLDQESGAPEALRRRADATFPPVTYRIWVDVKGDRVTSESWLSKLELPYERPRDSNIRTDRWPLADRACPVNDWSGLCNRMRKAAQEALWDDEFKRTHFDAVRRLEESQAAHRAQWASRIARLPAGPTREAETMAALRSERLDASLLAGLREPSIRADSMGAVYLSGMPLEGA
jgi:ATP-dependent helicase HepA